MDIPYRREQSAGYLVNWAGRLFVRAVERRLLGGTAGQMPVYFALLESSAMSQKDLARWAAVEQPTMANTLARMQRDGLVVSSPDREDRRSTRISLTKLGQQRAKQAMESAQAVNALGLGALKPAERELFLDMLRRMVAKLDADS